MYFKISGHEKNFVSEDIAMQSFAHNNERQQNLETLGKEPSSLRGQHGKAK